MLWVCLIVFGANCSKVDGPKGVEGREGLEMFRRRETDEANSRIWVFLRLAHTKLRLDKASMELVPIDCERMVCYRCGICGILIIECSILVPGMPVIPTSFPSPELARVVFGILPQVIGAAVGVRVRVPCAS
jgi:hypothetical protein